MNPASIILLQRLIHSYHLQSACSWDFVQPGLKSLQGEVLTSSPGILFYNPICKVVRKYFLNLHQSFSSSSFLALHSIFASWFAGFLDQPFLNQLAVLHFISYWGLRLLTWHWDTYLSFNSLSWATQLSVFP